MLKVPPRASVNQRSVASKRCSKRSLALEGLSVSLIRSGSPAAATIADPGTATEAVDSWVAGVGVARSEGAGGVSRAAGGFATVGSAFTGLAATTGAGNEPTDV